MKCLGRKVEHLSSGLNKIERSVRDWNSQAKHCFDRCKSQNTRSRHLPANLHSLVKSCVVLIYRPAMKAPRYLIMSYCGCGYPYSYSPYQYYGYQPYMAYPSFSYYPLSYGLPLGYVYSGPFTYGYPRGEHRVGNCLMICQ